MMQCTVDSLVAAHGACKLTLEMEGCVWIGSRMLKIRNGRNGNKKTQNNGGSCDGND